MAFPTAATASNGKVSMTGDTLKVSARNSLASYPGEPVEWHSSYIFIRKADPAAVAAYHYRGYDPNNPAGIDVTGRYRVIDVYGGALVPGTGCITGKADLPFNIDTPSVAFCHSAAVQKIIVKTGSGEDGVKLEATDPAGSVSSFITSTISTGKGHDGVLGGNGPDRINTGGDSDGAPVENTATGKPETVDGRGGNDRINLGSPNTFNSPDSSEFPGGGAVFGDGQMAHGGDGNDLVATKGLYFDRIFGDDGNDSLRGGKGSDEIFGGNGDDYVNAGKGENYVYGEDGADSLTGGSESDELYGGSGPDEFNGGNGDDMVVADDDDSHDASIKCGSGDFDVVFFDSTDGDSSLWKDCETKTLR